ncbi:AFG1-like ATPase isoform X3 [Mauremys reevesii]|uniref:AFG1-like ATPase isoform X3 n=1 Tax=Mauremys reevesii TaxID=260615 RepID=UPI00193FC151|nr:AFG1-like ATPase isoform X3 [Mauremys reevesii]
MAAPVSPLVTAARHAARLLPARAAAPRRAYTIQAAENIAPNTLADANSRALLVCNGPLEHYDFLIKAEELRNDEQQRRVVQCLQKLHESLKGYSISPNNLLSKLFAKSKPPKGLYIYGDVGTGKTMVMDMFYSYIEVERKKRVHFHGFMLDVHKRIHRLKQSLPKRKPGLMAKSYDPIAPIAEEISEGACLLCFDEFQKYCSTIQLDSGIDYRKRVLPAAGKLYYLTSEADVEAVMDKLFDELAQKQNDLTRPRILKVQGRELKLNKACGTIADFTFEELCDRCRIMSLEAANIRGFSGRCKKPHRGPFKEQSAHIAHPVGASDYLEISKNFDTVFVRNIPLLTIAKRTQARRFITLIDTFYDHKVRIICSALTPLQSLFLLEHHDSGLEESRILMDDLGLSQDSAGGLSMFTGEEEIFAFHRTISRLTEMQTEQYWKDGDRSKK